MNSSLFAPESKTEPEPERRSQLPEKPYRWVIFAAFGLLAAANGICWTVFAPISLQVTRQYGVSQLTVDFVSLVYMIVYVLFNFPAIWILDQRSLRSGIVLGAFLTALGAALRVGINYSFSTIMVGQILLAFGQPLILNAPAKVAWHWFNAKSRPVAIALLSTFNIVGTGIGFLLPSFFVEQMALDNSQNFMWLMATQAAICFVAFFIVAAFYVNGQGVAEQKVVPFWRSLNLLSKNVRFIALFLSFSIILGTFNTIASLSNQLLKPTGMSDDLIAVAGACMIGLGIAGALGTGLYVQKTQNFAGALLLCSMGGTFLFLLDIVSLQIQLALWLQVVLFGSIGFFLISMMPLTFDFGCQQMRPIGQAQIVGLMMTGGQVVGIVLTVIFQIELDLKTKQQAVTSMVVMVLLLALGCPLVYFGRTLKPLLSQRQFKGVSLVEQID